MPKIVISDPALFCAAALFTSSEQTRPYLHGVYIEPAEGGGVLLTATDDHKLFHAYDPEGVCSAATIIKPEKAKMPPAWAKPGAIWIDRAAGTMTHDRTQSVMGATILHDCTFPDYRRVVPKEFSGEVGQFDLAQLAAFAAVSKLLDGSKARVSHNGDGPALLTFGGHRAGYGILMPLRTNVIGEAPLTLPELPQSAAQGG